MQFNTIRLYRKQQPFKSNLFRPRPIQGHSVTVPRHRVSEQFHRRWQRKKMFVKSQAIGVFVGFTVAFMASSVSIFIDISLIDMYESHLFRFHLYLLIVSFWQLQLWVKNFIRNSSVFSGLIVSQSFLGYYIPFPSYVLEMFWSIFRFTIWKLIHTHMAQSPKLTYQALISQVAIWTVTWLIGWLVHACHCMVGLLSIQQ